MNILNTMSSGADDVRAATAGWRLHHTMYRVKDPQVSRDFYENKLGMKYVPPRDDNLFVCIRSRRWMVLRDGGW